MGVNKRHQLSPAFVVHSPILDSVGAAGGVFAEWHRA
jgi:hypothetical protein